MNFIAILHEEFACVVHDLTRVVPERETVDTFILMTGSAAGTTAAHTRDRTYANWDGMGMGMGMGMGVGVGMGDGDGGWGWGMGIAYVVIEEPLTLHCP